MQASARTADKANRDEAWLLYHGVMNILRCDEAEVVTGIAKYVMTQHQALRIGSALMQRTRATPLPSFAAFLGWMTRFLEVRDVDSKDGVIWVARLGNERRAIKKLIAALPDLQWTELKLERHPDPGALRALFGVSRMGPLRIMKIARLLHKKYEFFKVLRAIELIGYYARYLGIFRNGRYRLAVMSSHSNPHGIAFNLAARRCNIPVVLITHGMPVRPVARLQYDLGIVHCEAARRTYAQEGGQMTGSLVHGRLGQYQQMSQGQLPDRLTVGIFLCKDVNESRLRLLTADLLNHPRVSAILIRPHPKNLWRGLPEWVASLETDRVKVSEGEPVAQDLEAVDVVLAGNSSVLIDAVTAGRPSAYVTGLDFGSRDMHQFVECGLIYQLGDQTLRLDPDELLGFYQRREWPSVLRLFANVEEDEEAVIKQAAIQMRHLAGESRAYRH